MRRRDDRYNNDVDIRMRLDQSYDPDAEMFFEPEDYKENPYGDYETEGYTAENYRRKRKNTYDDLYDEPYDDAYNHSYNNSYDDLYDDDDLYDHEVPNNNNLYDHEIPDDDESVYEQERRGRRSSQTRKDNRKPNEKRVKNNQIMGILYGFLVLFFCMIGYFVYFDVIKSEEAVNNPNNIRIAKLADTVTRGKILASDGSVLAETLKDGAGNEYRNYPYENMFAHVVGVSKTNKSGIESSYEYYLLNSNINPMQKAINEIKGEKSIGDNVVTTLNRQLQETAYHALGNNKGVVVAMDPTTGKVLAMVSKPDYNPNTLAQNYESIIAEENSKVLLNQATNGKFTPGSIFKMVTALEYMREYPNYSNYGYRCNGGITLSTGGGSTTLRCYNGHVHGYQGLTDSFANSCNASFANIGLNLNTEKFGTLCNELLFNQSLPTNIPHSKSVFSLENGDSEWEIGATAIGQGDTAITPLHALMLTSAVANGGNVMKPYLVDSIINDVNATVEKFTPESYGNIMSTSEAEQLKMMMKEVVNRGTATSLSGMGYEIAGKTGTAEVDNAGNNAWFVGFAPAESPRIAVCVLVEDSEASSSYAAVPVAKQLFSTYLQ